MLHKMELRGRLALADLWRDESGAAGEHAMLVGLMSVPIALLAISIATRGTVGFKETAQWFSSTMESR